jgi:hypothetical protein
MIQFTSGDLLQAETQYIAQGVATGSQEGLGTGLALKISTKWPDVQQHFKKHTRSSTFVGGDVFAVAPTAERPGVIYVATQPDMYHATLNYLNKGLRNLVKFCLKHNVQSVALRKLAPVLGKLDWDNRSQAAHVKVLCRGSHPLHHLRGLQTTVRATKSRLTLLQTRHCSRMPTAPVASSLRFRQRLSLTRSLRGLERGTLQELERYVGEGGAVVCYGYPDLEVEGYDQVYLRRDA